MKGYSLAYRTVYCASIYSAVLCVQCTYFKTMTSALYWDMMSIGCLIVHILCRIHTTRMHNHLSLFFPGSVIVYSTQSKLLLWLCDSWPHQTPTMNGTSWRSLSFPEFCIASWVRIHAFVLSPIVLFHFLTAFNIHGPGKCRYTNSANKDANRVTKRGSWFQRSNWIGASLYRRQSYNRACSATNCLVV